MARPPSARSTRPPARPAAAAARGSSGRVKPARRSPAAPPRRSAPVAGALAALLAAALPAASGDARAQQPARDTLRVPGGPSLVLPADTVRGMLERTRRLQTILEEDPDVLYYLSTGEPVSAEEPARAYPWNAVRPVSDSVARVTAPGNYREARRAYNSYAVRKMEILRERPPAARCPVAVEREAEALSAFVEGWIVARTLYGGPAFPPVDAFVFAREAGHLPAMAVALGDSQIGLCSEIWARENPGAMEAYRAWRQEFDGDVGSGDAGAGAPDGSG